MKILVRTNLKHNVVALDDVSFEVAPGEILAVVGPNGAGKSTAFRVLVGLTSATTGKAEVMGLDCGRQSQAVRREVGWMPAEDRSLLMRLSCRENLRFHGRMHGMNKVDIAIRTEEALEEVGLTAFAEATPFALSAGMKARLQLARALFHKPAVLILDEPTGSVDPVAAHALLELIIDIVKQRQIAALISSHRLEEIEALQSKAILLDRGRIRYSGNLDELRKGFQRAQVELEFDSSEAARQAADVLTGSEHVESIAASNGLVTAIMKPRSRVANVLGDLGSSRESLAHIRDTRTPLRDILASMYRDEEEAAEEPTRQRRSRG